MCIIIVNQIEIHPFLAWDEVVDYCRLEGIVIMAYSPLAKVMKLKTPKLVSIAEKYVSLQAKMSVVSTLTLRDVQSNGTHFTAVEKAL